MSNGIHWGAVEPRTHTGITVACLKMAAVDLKEALAATTVIGEVSAILDTALLLEREFSQLADAAARKVDRLEATRFTGRLS